MDDLAPGWTKDEVERIKSGAVHPGIGLRVLRHREGVSLAEAAAAAKVDPSTLSRLERGPHSERDLFRAVLDGPLTITSEPLAQLLGFASARELTEACEEIREDD